MTSTTDLSRPTARFPLVRAIGPILCSLAALGAFAFAYHWIGGAIFPNDDAYIALHDAQAVWAGRDEIYRGVPALYGETSGVRLALLLLFECFLKPEIASFCLGATISVAYVLGLYTASMGAGCSRPEATAIALSGLVVGGSIAELLNGLDTGLAMAVVAWAIALLIDRARWRQLALLCGMMPFARPELGLLAAGSMLILLIEPERSWQERKRALLLAVASATPFMLAYFIEIGTPFPSTMSAKAAFFAQHFLDWHTKLGWLISILSRALLTVFPLVLCVGFIRPVRLRALLLVFTAIFLAAYFWQFPGGLTHNYDRYLFVFVPMIIFGVACGVASEKRWQRIFTLAFIGMSLPCLWAGLQAQIDGYRTGLRFESSIANMTDWMNTNLPSGAKIMLHDAGYVAFKGHWRLIDLVGLKTPSAADVHRELTYPSAGTLREEAVARIADDFRPDYLMVIHNWDVGFHFVDALRDHGWKVDELYTSASPGIEPDAVYELYQLKPPQ